VIPAIGIALPPAREFCSIPDLAANNGGANRHLATA